MDMAMVETTDTKNPTHGELVVCAVAWLAGPMKMHAVIPELKTWSTDESPDVIAWRSVPHLHRAVSTVVECKTSRSDFLADRDKPHRRDPAKGMGEQRWYFTPKGLVDVDELPEGWGLAEVTAHGVRKLRHAKLQPAFNRDAELVLLVAALRRLHFPDPKFPQVHVAGGWNGEDSAIPASTEVP